MWLIDFVRYGPRHALDNAELQTLLNDNQSSEHVLRIRTTKYERALCEDPKVIEDWFRLVRNTISKHGIVESDIWNFDDTGFLLTRKVFLCDFSSARISNATG